MSKIEDKNYDNLIFGSNPETFVSSGSIRALAEAATLARGTVLAKSSKDSKLVVLGNSAQDTEEKFSGDGSTTTFTLTGKPLRVKSAKVGTTVATISSYNAQTGVVTLSSAPAAGTDNVVIAYEDEVLTPYAILCEDVEVGTSSAVDAPIYTMGCFNSDKLIVKNSYTMTESDKDALRNAGIYLKAMAV